MKNNDHKGEKKPTVELINELIRSFNACLDDFMAKNFNLDKKITQEMLTVCQNAVLYFSAIQVALMVSRCPEKARKEAIEFYKKTFDKILNETIEPILDEIKKGEK